MADEQRRETLERWSGLVKEAMRDEPLKRRLIEDPNIVLEEHGIKPRPGIEVRVVENTDKVAYLTLPAAPPQGELSMEQLDEVAGGDISFNFTTIHWTYTGYEK